MLILACDVACAQCTHGAFVEAGLRLAHRSIHFEEEKVPICGFNAPRSALGVELCHAPAHGWCREREKIDWQEPRKFDCRLVRTIFIFVVLRQFSQVVGKWPENQILIPDWTYFYCPDATLGIGFVQCYGIIVRTIIP